MVLNALSKLFVRLTIIAIAAYLVCCYACSYLFGIDIWHGTYLLLLEICVCLCISAQGNYHCKFIRWTAYAVTLSDTITFLDNRFDFIPTTFAVYIPFSLLLAGMTTTLTLSIRHYIKVKRLKRVWKTERKNLLY